MQKSARNRQGAGSGRNPKAGTKPAEAVTSMILAMDRAIDGLRGRFQKAFNTPVLFLLILAMGTFARVWEYRQLPPGLYQDEASIGLEAYDLLHFGVDRNGISYPVNFVAWGSGMDALYGYVSMPFVILGLRPLTVRLPNLVFGLLMLPLIYDIGKRSVSSRFGLLAMFLLAISPWHILLSRWAMADNILPVVFALGFACMLRSTAGNRWLIAAGFFFGISLYAYGAAYVAVPIFLACAVLILLASRRVRRSTLLLGLCVFALVAAPIALFVLVNAFGWNTIHLGLLTVPRLPVPARFLGQAATSSGNLIAATADNAWVMLKLLLINPTDGLVWNVVEPFGYLYAFSFPLALAGAALLLPQRHAEKAPEKLLLLAWLLASVCVGLAQSVNINRMGIIFLPIILCTAACLAWLGSQHKLVLAVLITAYLVSFAAFNAAYHGSDYRQHASKAFYAGLLPAIDFARQVGNYPICVTDYVDMPYIYVLFSERLDPRLYLDTIQYSVTHTGFRDVAALGRYTFGIQNCPADPRTIYVLSDEPPPENGIKFKASAFINYHVYVPRSLSP